MMKGDVASSKSSPASQPAPVVLGPGPTTKFLRETASLPKEKCEELLREFLAGSTDGQGIQMEALFRRWMTMEEPDKILERLSDISGSRHPEWALAFINAWAASDETAAMGGGKSSQFVSRYAHEFGKARGRYALENGHSSFASYLPKLTEPRAGLTDVDNSVFQSALPAMAREHPEVAKTVATADIPEGTKSRAIASVAWALAESDPKGAMAWIESLGVPKDSPAFSAVLAAWAKTDPTAAKAAWEAAGGPEPFPALFGSSAMIRAWKEPSNPLNQYTLAWSKDPFADVGTLFQALSAEGLDWEKKSQLIPAIDRPGWYIVDAEAAAREAEKLPPGKARDFILEAICNSWVSQDQDAALRFAETHQIKSPLLEKSRSSVPDELERAALTAPQETFAVLFDPEKRDPNSPDFRRLYDLADQWMQSDPEAAAKWMIEQPMLGSYPPTPGPPTPALFENSVGYYWAKIDPIGATQWVDSLPDGPAKTKAWGAMHEYVAEYSPDYAFSLAAGWTQGQGRLSVLTNDLKKVQETVGQDVVDELLRLPAISEQERAALSEALRNSTKKPGR